MEVKKIVSKKIITVIIILGILFATGISVGLYYGLDQLFAYFGKDPDHDLLAKSMAFIFQQFEIMSQNYYKWVLPVIAGGVLILGWMLWWIMKMSISGTLENIQKKLDQDMGSGKKKKDFIDQKIEQDRKRRLYLHTLSVFQREGRLLDFFDEDLSEYDDEQIGAAVRSIQEDCKKAMKKYINPVPVINSEEGEKVVVEKDFDIDAIKLIGRVSGDPPFEGVLNHRGWKAGKREIPKLSDIHDSSIIIPAEVEIV